MLHFIVNSRARGTGESDFLDRLEKQIRLCGLAHRIVRPERRGHATALAREACAQGAAGVVAVGGDGTIHEVLNGLDERTPLGILPVGTCNDIARNLGLPADWRTALGIVAAGRTARVDVGLCGERRFLSVAGTGLDARVGLQVNRLPRGVRGGLAYHAFLFAHLLLSGPQTFRFVLEDEVIEEKAWLVAVANTEAYGGGLRIAPAARPDDGRLHVCVIRNMSRRELIRRFPLVYRGEHVTHPLVRSFATRAVELVAVSGSSPLIADGEPAGWLPVSLRIRPQAVEVFL